MKFLYKVYRPTESTLYNRVRETDFEGEFSTYATYWQGLGSGVTISRSRAQAWPTNPAGYRYKFDGINDRMYYMPGNIFATSLALPYVFIDIEVTPADWADRREMVIAGNAYVNSGVTDHGGYMLGCNWIPPGVSVAAGFTDTSFITFSIKRNSQWGFSYFRPTGLTGRHRLTGTYDGRYTRIYLDGVLQHTQDAGANYAPQYGTAGTVAVGVGAMSQAYNGGLTTDAANLPQGKYFKGSIDYLQIGGGGTSSADVPTAAQVLSQYENKLTKAFGSNNVAWTFDDTANPLQDLFGPSFITNDGATYEAGELPTRHSLRITTSTGGAIQQGASLTTAGRIVTTAGNKYTASVYVFGTAGHSVSLQVTPIGAGTATKSTVTLTGGWQRVVHSVTMPASSTHAQLDLIVENANASIKNVYFDAVMFEDGDQLHDFFNRYTEIGPAANYYYDNTNNVHYSNITLYDYITTWTDEVTNEPSLPQEINTAGSDYKIVLARPADSYGERTDVDFQNKVEVWAVDEDAPNGTLLFQGFISSYKPVYGGERVEVTLLGYGAEADDYIVEAGSSTLITQDNALAGSFGFNNYLSSVMIGQSFTATGDNIESISLYMYGVVGYSSGLVRLRVWDNALDAYEDSPSNVSTAQPIAQAYYTNVPTTIGWIDFTLTSTLRTTPGQVLYFTLVAFQPAGSSEPETHRIGYSDANPYSGGAMFKQFTSSSDPTFYPNNDLAFKINANYGGTTVAFLSADPADIVRTAIDDMQRQGCKLVYDDTSILDTGTEVTYTFKNETGLDYLKKALELAPADWFFYIDQATNTVHFKSKDDVPTHRLVLGKHFAKIEFDKRTESIVNSIYFTGGEVSPGVNLFKKYETEASIDLYGKKLLKYTDNRVTRSDTAEIIAQAILDAQSTPEVRTTIAIVNTTYDNEIIRPGDLIEFRAFSNTTAEGSLWDIAEWDSGFWDYDIANPETLTLQIARFDYTPDLAQMTLSTTPPDVNKRIEDIKRNLDAVQTIDNPSAPEVD